MHVPSKEDLITELHAYRALVHVLLHRHDGEISLSDQDVRNTINSSNSVNILENSTGGYTLRLMKDGIKAA